MQAMINQKWIGIGIVGVIMLLTGCSGDKAQMLG